MRVMRIVFLTTIAAGVCEGQTRLPASQPATSSTRPGGAWYCWSDAGLARTVGYGTDCIWLAGSGLVWRYDVKTGKRKVFTPCDGLPLEQGVVTRLTVAPDGTCVLRFSARLPAYLYRQGKGWQELPLPKGGGSVSFGPDNMLYYLQRKGTGQSRLWRRDGSEWKGVADLPNCQTFVPLKSGFLLEYMQHRFDRYEGSSIRRILAYVRPDGSKTAGYEQEKTLFMKAPRRYFHAGEKTYVVFHRRAGGDVYRRVTPRKLLKDEQAAALDPANAMPLGKPSGDPRNDRGRRARLMMMPGLLPALLPPQHLADHTTVLGKRRYAYDPAKRAWTDLAAGMAPVFRNKYDPATREVWWSTSAGGKWVRQLVKLEGNKRRPLRNIPELNFMGIFKFKDSAGRWWGTGTSFAFRLDSNNDKIRRYPCARGIDGGYRPQMQLSPNGNVWIWTEKTCLRYDETKDKFVEDEPWDDFAFAFGPWQLSMAGAISSSTGQAIYRKEDGTWRPMPEPFGNGSLRGTGGMIRGDRMLIVGRRGVLEYSAKADRWVLLHGYGHFRASYTPTGQRVLVNRYCVLLYDGEPMAPVSREDKKEQAIVDKILKLLDDDRWRVREDATEKLKKLYPAVADRLVAATKDPLLPLEVRLRLKLILKKNALGLVPMVSLFRSMHPLVKAPR